MTTVVQARRSRRGPRKPASELTLWMRALGWRPWPGVKRGYLPIERLTEEVAQLKTRIAGRELNEKEDTK